ncbi:28893_t:CDS:2 [Gigaspora margarita]|uniref:28893_t:CDS:1 n=1 Tax=Gigaspora margarita TaxID=4874 RepID=A0ABN7UDN0_GIGMA|nr:28893_t:CDS:2 [Gigaspora margarita]
MINETGYSTPILPTIIVGLGCGNCVFNSPVSGACNGYYVLTGKKRCCAVTMANENGFKD